MTTQNSKKALSLYKSQDFSNQASSTLKNSTSNKISVILETPQTPALPNIRNLPKKIPFSLSISPCSASSVNIPFELFQQHELDAFPYKIPENAQSNEQRPVSKRLFTLNKVLYQTQYKPKVD